MRILPPLTNKRFVKARSFGLTAFQSRCPSGEPSRQIYEVNSAFLKITLFSAVAKVMRIKFKIDGLGFEISHIRRPSRFQTVVLD